MTSPWTMATSCSFDDDTQETSISLVLDQSSSCQLDNWTSRYAAFFKLHVLEVFQFRPVQQLCPDL